MPKKERNRARGKIDEKAIGAKLHQVRYWANAGGPLDLHPIEGDPGPFDYLAIQVKGGLAVINQKFRDAVETAKKGAKESIVQPRLPCYCIRDRKKPGTVNEYIVFPLEEWIAWQQRNEPPSLSGRDTPSNGTDPTTGA